MENPHHARRPATQLLWTTPELVHLEQQLLDWAEHRSPLSAALVTASTIAGELVARPELSAEQAAMVRAACTSGEFVQVIAGRPGAGKTHATEAVVAAHVAAGVPIVGCAVSATAAAELEQSAGFARSTVPATTVAKLLQDLDHPNSGGLAAGTVVVVDEASMIATRDLHRLAVHTRRAGGRIKLIGDPDQHGAVDVGGVFAHLCSRDPGRVVHLVDNNRQQDHTDRLAIGDYRQGRIGDALDRYDQAGKIVRGRTAGEVYDHMAADWYAAHRNGHADPMIAGPNTTRRALNDRARALLHANGELTGAPLRAGGREFQAGDLVVARRNDRTLRGQAGDEFVKNGSAGTITRLDHDNGAITVRFEREGDIQLPGSYTAAGHLDHGYARTSYGVQGATHDVARYLPEDNASFEEGYVALTRGRTATRIYLVDGAEPAETDTAHGQTDRPSANLETIETALSRRRANLMAADHSPDLADVAQLRGDALLDLADASSRLRSQVGAPPAADSIQAANTNLESALLRRRANLPNDATQAERQLQAAHNQQSYHDAWLQVTADPRGAIDLIGRAANAQLAQLRHGALAALPTADEPFTATGRRHLRQAAGAVAIYHARHQPDIDPDASGPERLLGPRPAPGPARQEYDRASTAIRTAMTNSQAHTLD